MLNGFIQFIEAGHSWYVECAGLFLIPFLHEDVAILAGNLMLVEHRLPMPLAVGSIFAGMVASDFLLYGLGVLARRSLWIHRLLLRPGTVRMGNGWAAMSASRWRSPGSFQA